VLAEMLLGAAKKPADALKEYEAVLQKEPNRYRAVSGAMAAAKESGDKRKTQAMARLLMKLGTKADPGRQSLVASRIRGAAGLLLGARLGRAMVGYLFLVALHLAIDLVEHRVDRRIHVLFDGIGEHRGPAGFHRRLRLVAQLLDAEHDMDTNQLVEMTLDSLKLGFNVFAQCRRDIDMVSGQFDLHAELLMLEYCVEISDSGQALAFMRGRYVHRLAVLGHGASRDIDALI